ncbi:MAG TPA: hypothetical protein P5137_04260 [Candidatus Brocadiia bacterium]|nr:hypothetical protein [Candidatus Brocadiia bacterium]
MRLSILGLLLGLAAAVCGCDAPGPSPWEEHGRPTLKDEATMYESPASAGDELVSLSAATARPSEKEAELNNPFQIKKAVKPSRVQIILDGQKMTASESGEWWEIKEPVAADPMMSFTTDLSGALRVNLALWPCNEDGSFSSAKGYSLADPTGKALQAGKPFCLSAPDGCLIVGEGSEERIPLKSGQRYMVRLRVASVTTEESVTLMFRVR